ncbi:MAG: hypothetical protein JWP97_5181 [Labilithrix sp.]|nr:hypothetical protein [Labilithrix sp.]
MANSTWTIDGAHSSATFSVRHLMITNVRGEFGKVTGEVSFDPENPEAATAHATIEVGSINTRDAGRDTHLKSADFFDVEKFPSIGFTSKSVKKTSKGLELTGELTIRDASRTVVLEVEGPSGEQKDPWGNTRIGASARTKIKRSEFGITWNAALELGGVAVGDEVTIDIDVSLVKAK